MNIDNIYLRQLLQTIPEVVTPQVDNLLDSAGEKITTKESAKIGSYAIALILIEIAAKLAENQHTENAVTYRIVQNDEAILPDDVVDSVAGWLMAPEENNPLSGKTLHNFPFDIYGA